jgi:dUTPase
MKKQIYPKIVIENLVSKDVELQTDNYATTSRGSGGFGSTDMKVRIKENL